MPNALPSYSNTSGLTYTGSDLSPEMAAEAAAYLQRFGPAGGRQGGAGGLGLAVTDPYASQDSYNQALERAYHNNLHIDSSGNWKDVARSAAIAATIGFGGSALAGEFGGAAGAGGLTGVNYAGTYLPEIGAAGGGAAAVGTGSTGGGFFSSLLGGGSGGNMGLGIKDWLNIGNTVLGAYGANRAADTQAGASDAAIAEARRQFDINQANQAPYQAAGVGALGNLTNPNANFQASPDYAFRRSEGQRDLGNSFAARGGAFSGNALKALDQYNQSLASGEFGNWWNRQAGLAGVGQASVNQQGQVGQQTAGMVGNALQNAGDARASGIAGMYGAVNNGLSNYLYGRRGQNPSLRGLRGINAH